MKLSKNFTLEEFVKSSTATAKGIDNTPTAEAKAHIMALVTSVLQPIREAYGKPIIVTSGYRSEALNKAVGGSKTSQHLKGKAADIKAADGNNKALFDCIKKMIDGGKITVHQLIWEYGTKKQPNWVHVGLYQGTKKNQILYYYS